MKKILEDLVFLGAVTEPVKAFGMDFSMKTLTADEHLEATNATGDYDTLSRIYALKLEILARSIKSVNDEPIEDKYEMLKTLKAMQAPVVNKLYDEFEKIQVKQSKSLEDFDQIKN